MFDFQGFPELKAIYWQNLRPGMILAEGVAINGGVPPELRDFPLLTAGLLEKLQRKYQFLCNRSVLIYSPTAASLPAGEISSRLQSSAMLLEGLNGFRSSILAARAELVGQESAGRPLLESDMVRQDSLILDHWASGIRVYDDPSKRPTLLGDLRAAVTLADVLTGRTSGKFRLPKSIPFQLHAVVDASFSMKASGRDGIVRETLVLFDRWVHRLFPHAHLYWHAFSDTCAQIHPPFSKPGVARGETRYEAFVRKVLHSRTRDLPSTVMLFTDGVPSDRQAALEHLSRFARLGIDYTQIVFRIDEEGYGTAPDGVEIRDGYRVNADDPARPFPPDMQAGEAERVRREFSELAAAASGNQVILTVDRSLGVVAVEAFDRWLGAASGN